jgi:cytochrome c
MNARWLVLPVALFAVFSALGGEPRVSGQPRDGGALAPETLAERIGCLDCHSVEKKKVGPAFRDVAARYKNDAGARVALTKKVRAGGKGNWTQITGGKAMPSHSALASEAEISQLVDWILSR